MQMNLSEWEKSLLEYYLNNHNAKWMKVYNNKVVIFDIVKQERKDAVLVIREEDTKAWSFNTTIDGTYTGVNLDYTDPATGDTRK